MIEEQAFDKLFDEFAKTMDLAGREAIDDVKEEERRSAKGAVDIAARKWTYHFRILQDALKKAR